MHVWIVGDARRTHKVRRQHWALPVTPERVGLATRGSHNRRTTSTRAVSILVPMPGSSTSKAKAASISLRIAPRAAGRLSAHHFSARSISRCARGLILTPRAKISRNGGDVKKVPRQKCLPRDQPRQEHRVVRLPVRVEAAQRPHHRARGLSQTCRRATRAPRQRPSHQQWFQKLFAFENGTPPSVKCAIYVRD